MWYNPDVLIGVNLDIATVEQLLRAQYQLQLAAFTLVFAIVFFYFVFKVAVWFLPKFWQRSNE